MHPRSLLSVADLSDDTIDSLFSDADYFLHRLDSGSFKSTVLRGTSALLMFYEPSTRTRVSFELAGKMLGSDTINVSASGSSAQKGESLRDTALTLGAMKLSVVVLRHDSAEAIELFARSFDGPVINAGAGRGQHPTQALLDAMVLRSAGLLERGRHIAIVGDIQHSRVMRSGAQLLARRGLKITIVGPPSLIPEGWTESSAAHDYSPDLDAVLPELDAVMMLRMQHERMAGGEITNLDEYSKMYGLNGARLRALPEHAVIMHPGPVNRGVEISEEVFRDPRCRINEQVTAGLALRCALLCHALEKDARDD